MFLEIIVSGIRQKEGGNLMCFCGMRDAHADDGDDVLALL